MASLLSYALTNVSDVKESLGIASSTHTYDNLITRKINQATRAIEAYCSRRFLATDYTDEGYNATNTDTIILRQRPVVSVTSLEIRDAGINVDNFTTVDTQLYFIDANAGLLNLYFSAIGRWSRYRVTYNAGYTTIPEDLAEACASIAAYYVTNASGSMVGLSRKVEGQRATQFGNNNHLLSFANIAAQLGIDSILDSYSNYPLMTGR